MYCRLPDVWFSPEWCEQLVNRCAVLDLDPGPGGSHMSDFNRTFDLLWPPLHDQLLGFWTLCTIAALYPSSQIVAHKDAPVLGYRTHIPIQTNPGCWSYHDGLWQRLDLGQGYRMDPTQAHGSVNWGDERRLHLIVDRQRA